jgi:hypothetical protein
MMRLSNTSLIPFACMAAAKNQGRHLPWYFLFLVQQVGCIAIFQLAQPEQAELPRHHLHPILVAGERPVAIRVTTSFGVVSL